jgi:catechol 1,2-dioxygenase
MTRRRFLAALAGAVAAGACGAGAATCVPTEDNPQGPFYIPDAPLRVDIAPGGEPGERLDVGGRVLSAAGCRPLTDAVVEVWHANATGAYYGLEGATGEGAWQLRGRARTGKDGSYRFETILPGRYPLSPRQLRPRHIHYLVAAPGHRPVVTQLYFAGDPSLSGDPLVRPSLIMPLGTARTGGGGGTRWSVVFDVTLAPR